MRSTRRLTDTEVRIAGTLMEKEQTTPAAYPMTVNSLRAACNQRTNRDPVTDLGEGAIRDGLESLRKDVLVWRSAGARVEHWEHRLTGRWGLQKSSKAVLTLLMLRGAQTAGELRTRSERMAHFDTVDEVVRVLMSMSDGDHPMAQELSPAPGQRESRWRHLMGVQSEPRSPLVVRETTAKSVVQSGSSTTGVAGEARDSHVSTVVSAIRGDEQVERIATLEAQVADLDERLRFLEEQLT